MENINLWSMIREMEVYDNSNCSILLARFNEENIKLNTLREYVDDHPTLVKAVDEKANMVKILQTELNRKKELFKLKYDKHLFVINVGGQVPGFLMPRHIRFVPYDLIAKYQAKEREFFSKLQGQLQEELLKRFYASWSRLNLLYPFEEHPRTG